VQTRALNLFHFGAAFVIQYIIVWSVVLNGPARTGISRNRVSGRIRPQLSLQTATLVLVCGPPGCKDARGCRVSAFRRRAVGRAAIALAPPRPAPSGDGGGSTANSAHGKSLVGGSRPGIGQPRRAACSTLAASVVRANVTSTPLPRLAVTSPWRSSRRWRPPLRRSQIHMSSPLRRRTSDPYRSIRRCARKLDQRSRSCDRPRSPNAQCLCPR